MIPLPLKRSPIDPLSRLSVSPAWGCRLCVSHAGAQLSSLVLRAGDAIGGHDCRFLSVWSVSPIVGRVSHGGCPRGVRRPAPKRQQTPQCQSFSFSHPLPAPLTVPRSMSQLG